MTIGYARLCAGGQVVRFTSIRALAEPFLLMREWWRRTHRADAVLADLVVS